MDGSSESRHVSAVILDDRSRPSIVKTFVPHNHLKEDSATPEFRLFIFLNDLGRSRRLEFNIAGSQPWATEKTRCGAGCTQCSIAVVAPSVCTGGIRYQLGWRSIFPYERFCECLNS